MIFKEEANVSYSDFISVKMPSMTSSQRAALKWATIEEYDRVLDMNCGNGAMLKHLSDHYRLNLCGLSSNFDEVRAVRDHLEDADIVYALPNDIPFRSESFDEVFVTSQLQSHCSQDALLEIFRVLRPGGQLIIACSMFRFLSAFSSGESFSDINKKDLMRALQQAGFKDVSWRNTGFTGIVIAWRQDILR